MRSVIQCIETRVQGSLIKARGTETNLSNFAWTNDHLGIYLISWFRSLKSLRVHIIKAGFNSISPLDLKINLRILFIRFNKFFQRWKEAILVSLVFDAAGSLTFRQTGKIPRSILSFEIYQLLYSRNGTTRLSPLTLKS